MTITEKILARAAGRKTISPGEYIEVSSRCPVTIGHHSIGKRGLEWIEEWGVKLFDPDLVRIVDGHTGASASWNAAEDRWEAQRWARALGIPKKNVINLGRGGVENMIAAENAWPLPGEPYFQGVNGHLSTVGALGAFACALSYGTGAYMMTGKTWLRVPKSIKIVLTGTLPAKGLFARDVFEFILGRLGGTAAGGGVVEWTGPAVDALSMDERFSLCSPVIFLGAWTAIMNPDERTLDYVRARTTEPFTPVVSDPDANYADVYEFDVSEIEPQVVVPPQRVTAKPVRDVEGTPLNRGFIGSDNGGWIEHMRVAARILKGRQIPPDVILNVTPGTVNILKQMLDEDIYRIFIDAGCVVPTPNEGMEGGVNTPLAAGEVCINAGQTNYPGRMGSPEAEIYLANPATVAASCLEGKITDPRKYL